MKTLKACFVIFFILVIATACAVVMENFTLLQGGKVVESITVHIDDTEWSNGTKLDWGTLYKGGSSFRNLTVTNIGTNNLTIYLIITDLPAGWTETWTGNATLIEPDESVSGNLTLTVSATASAGTYSWSSYIATEIT